MNADSPTRQFLFAMADNNENVAHKAMRLQNEIEQIIFPLITGSIVKIATTQLFDRATAHDIGFNYIYGALGDCDEISEDGLDTSWNVCWSRSHLDVKVDDYGLIGPRKDWDLTLVKRPDESLKQKS